MERGKTKIKMEAMNNYKMCVDAPPGMVAFDTPEPEKKLIVQQPENEKMKRIKTEEVAINYAENQTVTDLKKKLSKRRNQVLEKNQDAQGPPGMVAFDTPEPEKRLIGHQPENEKLKRIKTEEVAINYAENQTVTDLKKKLSELRNQDLEKNQDAQGLKSKVAQLEKQKSVDDQTIKVMKTQLSKLVLSEEELRQMNAEANLLVEELSHKISACEDEIKMCVDAPDRIPGMAAFDTPKPEKRLTVHQLENEKLKRSKTEEVAINYAENKTVTDLKKNLSELRNQVLEKNQDSQGPPGMVAFDTPEPEKRLIGHQPENEKLKGIKTEEVAINYSKSQTVTDLKKKLSELRNQVLEKNQDAQGLKSKVAQMEKQKSVDDQTIKEMKTRLSKLVLSEEELRQMNAEANLLVEELSHKISACEDEIKMCYRIQDDMKRRESENIRYMENLRRQNWEANRTVEGLKRRLSGFEVKTSHGESENIRCVEKLRRRVSALEEDKKMSDRVLAEMKLKESDLRREKLEAEQAAEVVGRQLSKADLSVKETRVRVSEACKAAEVNMERYGTVLPIAEELCELLKMNVEELVNLKDKLVCAATSTTTHGEEGGEI